MYKILLNKQETDKERNIIYQIAYENGYNKNTVNKIENKIKYKIKTEQLRINQTEQHINNNNNKKWATFTYINNKMTKLTKLFKNTDIKIAYKTNKNKLQNLNSSHNKDNTTTNGIYKIECQDCNKCYIGQTKKKQLKKRYFCLLYTSVVLI